MNDAKNELLKTWQVPGDLSEVRKAGDQVVSFFKPVGLSESDAFDVRLCFEEALINAIKYGSGLRRELPVDVEIGYDSKKIWMKIEDCGKGFDASRLCDCTRGENILREGGRGIYLIRQLMDEVQYNSRGNSLLMVKSTQGRNRTL